MKKKIVFILFFMLVLVPVLTATANISTNKSNIEMPVTFFLNNMNQPPDPPTEPEPEDEAVDMVVDLILSVLVSDPDFEIYIIVKFYDASDDSYIGSDVTYTNNTRVNCKWENLRPLTTYTWYTIAKDSLGESTQSDTWEFTTGIENNNPPTVPTINGPTSGRPNKKYYYTFISTDPDDHDVYYEIDWGDGRYDTIGPYTSNILKNKYHSWDEYGNFTIRARTKDVYGEYSDWGEYNIKIVKKVRIAFNLVLLRFLEQFPILQKILLLQR